MLRIWLNDVIYIKNIGVLLSVFSLLIIKTQSWALNTFLYLNTKYMLQMFSNTKYIYVFKYLSKYFFKYLQNIDLFNPLTFLK